MNPTLLNVDQLEQFRVYEFVGKGHTLDFYMYLGYRQTSTDEIFGSNQKKTEYAFVRYLAGTSHTSEIIVYMNEFNARQIQFKETAIKYSEEGDYK